MLEDNNDIFHIVAMWAAKKVRELSVWQHICLSTFSVQTLWFSYRSLDWRMIENYDVSYQLEFEPDLI